MKLDFSRGLSSICTNPGLSISGAYSFASPSSSFSSCWEECQGWKREPPGLDDQHIFQMWGNQYMLLKEVRDTCSFSNSSASICRSPCLVEWFYSNFQIITHQILFYSVQGLFIPYSFIKNHPYEESSCLIIHKYPALKVGR